MQISWKLGQNFFCKICKQRTSQICLNFTASSFIFGRISCENVPRTFLETLQAENFQYASELHIKQLCFGHKYLENAPRTFLHTFAAENLQNAFELHSKWPRFWMHKLWKCAQNNFHKPCNAKTSKTHLNFTGNIFIFGRINRENAPRIFFTKLARLKLPNCVWTLQPTASFLDANFLNMCPELFWKPCKRRTSEMHLNFTAHSFVFEPINNENAPRCFSVKLANRNFQNASELHSKQLCFWTHESWKCAQDFCVTCKWRTFKMRPNFMPNSCVHGHINRENAPIRFSVKLASTDLQKYVWTSQQTASFLDVQIVSHSY